MTWQGGFSGVGFDRAEFRQWLRTQPKPPYHRIVNHMTDAPYMRASVPCSQRIRNLGNYYRNDLGWSGGPDFFVLGDGKVYLGSPLGHSIGCSGWNGNSFHIECEGRYDGKTHDHKTGLGLENWKTMAWVQAELLDWMGWQADGERIKLHKEGRTGHNCPGIVPKDWIVGLINEARGVAPKPAEPKTVWVANVPPGDWLNARAGPGTLYDIKGRLPNGIRLEMQQETPGWAYVRTPAGFLVWVSKSYLADTPPEAPEPQDDERKPVADMHVSTGGIGFIKRFEGLRLEPYDDNGSLAIGYGHSNRSKKPPVVTPDLRITEQEAEEILARDLIDYENRVKAAITAPLKQCEFDALVSIAYNWGPGNLDRSELRALVNAGKYREAEAEIRTILPPEHVKHYKGIKRRRNEEADLFAGR